MTQPREHQPPRRQDFATFTEHDAAWKQWMVDQITHLHWCIDEARDTASQLLTWMRGDELADARAEGAAGVTKKQKAAIAGAWNALGGKNIIIAVLILASGAAGAGLGRLL